MASSPGPAVLAVADRLSVDVHGACVGAGIELAAMASSIVAHPDTRFRLPELTMGLMPGVGGTWSIGRRIGRRLLLQWLLLDLEIDVDTALAWRLIDGVAERRDGVASEQRWRCAVGPSGRGSRGRPSALAEHVALNLVGAAIDGVRPGVQEGALELVERIVEPVAVPVVAVGARDQAFGSGDEHGEFAHAAMPVRRVEIAY